jgi:hypothetical protein
VISASCKKKKPVRDSNYISLPSLIRDQVKDVDTSLYSIIKVVITDTVYDTTYIRREDFEKEAKEFLDIPDLSDKKVAERYAPDSAIYDESLNRVIVTYNATDENEHYTKEQLLVTPNPGAKDIVNSLIIKYSRTTKDGSLTKDMLWTMDHSFQIVTLSQLPGQPEKITTTKVIWNEDPDQ